MFSCLQIFTEDLPEVENLPRRPVLDYLENLKLKSHKVKDNKNSKDLAIKYLV